MKTTERKVSRKENLFNKTPRFSDAGLSGPTSGVATPKMTKTS